MADWSWVASICDPERETCAKPWNMNVNGTPSVVATEGRVLLIVPGAWGEMPTADIEKSIRHVLNVSPLRPSVSLSWPALREFVGLPPVAPPVCPDCKGSGVGPKCLDCDGEGYTDCECDCGDIHEKKCRVCDGKGEPTCETCENRRYPEMEPVRIGGTPFNRHLLTKVVPNLEADEVMFSHEDGLKPAWFLASDWSLLVMPLRDDDSIGMANAPRFELGAVAA